MQQHPEQGAERHTAGKFAAVRRTSLLRQQAYLITWYAVFVCSFVLRLVGHGILFEGLEKLVLSFSLRIYTLAFRLPQLYHLSLPPHGILHDDGISGYFRKLRARVHDINVKIKLRDGELFIFKGHARAFDVASRVHGRSPTTAVAKGKKKKNRRNPRQDGRRMWAS